MLDTKHMNHFTEEQIERVIEETVAAQKAYRQGTNRPLEGIHLAVKDNIDVFGFRTTGGSAALKGHKSKRDSSLWQMLRQQGAICLGKTNMHEMAHGTSSLNETYGYVLNPRDSQRIASGSSGGSASAVGAGVAMASLGTDTGGSIRIPAAFCGVYGYRPTVNRWPADFGLKCSHIRDSVGPITNNINDIILLDSLISDET